MRIVRVVVDAFEFYRDILKHRGEHRRFVAEQRTPHPSRSVTTPEKRSHD